MIMVSDSRELDKIYKRRDRYDIPDWQRQEVWTQSKKQNLIDSILRGWKLPKFYFLLTSKRPEQFEVVDGQQRLVSIFEFFSDELPLSPTSAEEFGATSYSELPDSLSDRFDDYKIEYDVIEDASDQDVRKFFQRLQDGYPLTSSERLNSVLSGLRDFAAELVKHPFFRNKVMVLDRRYAHFDIAAKAAAVEIDGIDVGLRFGDLSAVFESQEKFSGQSNVAKRLIAALDFLDDAFGKPSPCLRNRTAVQSFITLAARLVASGGAAGYEKLFGRFIENFTKQLSRQAVLGQAATDWDYLTFLKTINANVRSGPRTRQEILLRKLLASHPVFSTLLDRATIEESGICIQIKKDGVEIRRLVGSLNEKYSSKEGKDLFKATNRTVQALHIISEPISDVTSYKELVDNLYFLFRESVGQRLDGRTPVSFRDVNQLRTILDHDVDHGKMSAVRAKKKNIGKVFHKYSGVTSAETLAPEKFPIMQANLLAALKADLESLDWDLR